MVLAGRQFLIWAREPFTTAQSILMPALSMVLIKVVMGDTIGRATGVNSVYGSVPMIILVGSMFGSMATALRLNQESTAGLLRLYVMPIHRGADLTARIVAELVRILGHHRRAARGGLPARIPVRRRRVDGLRPHRRGGAVRHVVLGVHHRAGGQQPAGCVDGALCVAAVDRPDVLQLRLHACRHVSGVVGADVEYQPMSPAIDVMRGLALGDRPIAHKLVIVFIWSAIMIVLFIYPAIRGYRKAATARG